MGHVNLLWSCISIIFAITIGAILFGEPFNRFTIFAIILAVAAIYFAQKADNLG
jgi:multidrug transporter EmrE-like cation transporter